MDYWIEDAQKLDTKFITNLITKTANVEDFLNKDKLVVIAPKGYGKTLLLKYKHQEIRTGNMHAIFIPHNTPLDSFDITIDIHHKHIDILSSKDLWEKLWIIAVGTSIILNHASIEKNYSLKDFRKIISLNLTSYRKLILPIIDKIINEESLSIQHKININPSNIIQHILFQQNLQDYLNDLPKLSNSIYQNCLSIQRSMYVFIDRIDQGFEKYPRELWQAAQIGLIKGIFALTSSITQIKIYASIRKEALSNQSDTLFANYKTIITNLTYSENELKEIFHNSIRFYEDINSPKPIEKFVDFENFENSWSPSKSEPLFRYIYRHTFQRPRDFIEIGKEIHSEIAKDNFDHEKFTDIVNHTPAKSIQRQYLDEIKKFTNSIHNIINNYNFFTNITTNILTRSDLINICERYNLSNQTVNTCIARNGGSCQDCQGANHIFCDLYKIGLIGTVILDATRDSYIQHFELAGNVESLHLPVCEYYLIHPGFDYYIKTIMGNSSYLPTPGIKVGNGCKWNKEYASLIQLTATLKDITNDSLKEELENAMKKNNLQSIQSIAKSIIAEKSLSSTQSNDLQHIIDAL